MVRLSQEAFERTPLRAHAFLAGVPLHDAWVVALNKTRDGITLDAFARESNDAVLKPSPFVRFLLGVRFTIGGALRWDCDDEGTQRRTFADRLTPDDAGRSLVPLGARKGPFRVVYRFDNEELAELANATAHGAVVTSLVETASDYRYYLGVDFAPVSRLTPVYMAAIDPVRRLFVYPSLLRSVRTSWGELRAQ